MSTKELDQKKVLVVLATFNEIENIPSLINELFSSTPDADVLVVDDNSPDGTGAWAQRLSENNPRVKSIVRKNERGLGSAVIRALSFAIENNYYCVVNLDADFSHSPRDVPRLLERLDLKNQEVDVVIGSRYVRGGQTPDWTLKRRIMSRSINTFARIALGLKTHDNSGSFRCYRVDALKKINLNNFLSNGYSFFEEMLYRLKISGFTFAEIPITFIDRKKGASKINKKEAIKAVWIMLKIGTSRFLKRR